MISLQRINSDMKSLFVFALLILASTQISAQNFRLTGKVANDKNEPLPGATIKVRDGAVAVSDVDGAFSIVLTPGRKYQVLITAVGYAPKTIDDVEVFANASNELYVLMILAATDLGGVTVSASTNAKKETVNAMIAFQKNTNTVAQVVSAEVIRRSPDKSTGEVLKRVPGTSIQDGKYLIVRGLADRYNQAMLNGILLTSTEADRKTFSFDLFPAAVVDNIVINKAFVPELPGEWAGGLIQVNTKDIPSAGFFNVQIGTGFNTQTAGHQFHTYKGGKYDWLGLDDGGRALPTTLPLRGKFEQLQHDAKTAYATEFKNIWSTQAGDAPLNSSFQLNAGFTSHVLGKKAGGVFALNHNRSNRRQFFNNRYYNISGPTAEVNFDYLNERFSQEVFWGALGNIAVQLNNNNKISFKNLFNVNASDFTTLRTGLDFESDPVNGENVRAKELGFRSTIYYNTQLLGEHNLPSFQTRFKWHGGFTILDQYTPDQRRIQYNQSRQTPDAPYLLLISNTLSQRSGNRFFSNLNDYIYSAGGDLSKTFRMLNFNQTIKGGYAIQVRDRLFDARPFSVYLESDDPQLKALDEAVIFSPENFGPGKFSFNQLSNKRYRYMANNILNAGYVQFDNQVSTLLRLIWGLRIEHFDQLIGSERKSDFRHSYSKVLDVLPGVNVTAKLNNLTNLRLSASQTVVRPELREIAAFTYFDFELNAAVVGNPDLKRTKVSNLDLRYELYPRAGELITAGVFYKHFRNAIEAYFNQSGPSTSTFNFLNARNAYSYGAEIEGRKKLDFSDKLKNFTVGGNLSYIVNEVNDEKAQIKRPMQGQSPYIINATIQYDLEKAGINTTLLFNQIGKRIIYVGNDQVPAIWEHPRPLLDFQLAKKIWNKKGEIKLNVSDILHQKAYFYHDLDKNESFKKESDAVAIRRNYGTTFSISFAYNFK